MGRNIDGHLLCPGGLLPAGEESCRRTTSGSSVTIRAAAASDGRRTCAGAIHATALRRTRLPRRRFSTPRTTTASCVAAGIWDDDQDPRQDDHQERGLLFICLNTDIARQFEFVQQTWILNSNFATLFDETDPLVGPKGHFTIPEQPLRRIVEVATFIQMAGGEYFFLPSIPALNYLAAP